MNKEGKGEEGKGMAAVHGGNVYEVASRLGCSPDSVLDFSASINPLGPPPGLWEELRRAGRLLRHYPDIHNRELLEALASRHGTSPGRVVAGNGSTELLYWLPKALGLTSALAAFPTFGEYPRAFEIQGVRLHFLTTRAEHLFQPTLDELDAAWNRAAPGAVLVTHPGSPSGTLLPSEVRSYLLDRCRREKIPCIVDEVFADFCEEESLKRFLDDTPELVLVRSMTKFYGIPGLRLGYLLASEAVATELRRCLPPWSVNTLAQAAGVYCLRQEDYRRETLELVSEQRESMRRALEAMPGMHPLPGRANYLMVRMDDDLPPARRLRDELLMGCKVLVRDCASFQGVGDRSFRVAVRLPQENRRLLEALREWLGPCGR